jgi:hypothetical protein
MNLVSVEIYGKNQELASRAKIATINGRSPTDELSTDLQRNRQITVGKTAVTIESS